MKNNNAITHFEIAADDRTRAQQFYQDTFGWNIEPVPGMQEYNMVYATPVDDQYMPEESGAINGGMYDRVNDLPGTTLVINTENIDEAVEAIQKNGGTIVREKVAVGDMGWVAYFKDTEGNTLGIWESMKK